MLRAFYTLLIHDLKLYCRRPGLWMMPMLFFVMVISVFPIALGLETAGLTRVAPAIIWVASVLSLLMSIDSLFRVDAEAGIIESLILSPYPLPVLALAKSLAHALAFGAPLFLLAPIASLLLQLPAGSMVALWASLLLGIPTLSLIGSMGAALTIGLPNGGLLMAVVVLPLMIPIVIFASSSVLAASMGLPYAAELCLLGALAVVSVVLGPVFIAVALRESIES